MGLGYQSAKTGSARKDESPTEARSAFHQPAGNAAYGDANLRRSADPGPGEQLTVPGQGAGLGGGTLRRQMEARTRVEAAGFPEAAADYAWSVAESEDNPRQTQHFETSDGRDMAMWAEGGDLQALPYRSDNPADYDAETLDRWDTSQTDRNRYEAAQESNQMRFYLVEELGYSPREAQCYLDATSEDDFAQLLWTMNPTRPDRPTSRVPEGFGRQPDPSACLDDNDFAQGLTEEEQEASRRRAEEMFPITEAGEVHVDPVADASPIRHYE
jgi:hypothetical protein